MEAFHFCLLELPKRKLRKQFRKCPNFIFHEPIIPLNIVHATSRHVLIWEYFEIGEHLNRIGPSKQFRKERT
jgi:hypothetical protein